MGATRGDPRCQYALGTWYAFGVGTRKNYGRAADLFEAAAHAGHADAQFNLGVCFEKGRGRQKNARSAFYWYQKAAVIEKGGSASGEAARCLYWGIGTKRNLQAAFRMFLQAARRGNVEAEYSVARLCEKGEGNDEEPKSSAPLVFASLEAW